MAADHADQQAQPPRRPRPSLPSAAHHGTTLIASGCAAASRPGTSSCERLCAARPRRRMRARPDTPIPYCFHGISARSPGHQRSVLEKDMGFRQSVSRVVGLVGRFHSAGSRRARDHSRPAWVWALEPTHDGLRLRHLRRRPQGIGRRCPRRRLAGRFVAWVGPSFDDAPPGGFSGDAAGGKPGHDEGCGQSRLSSGICGGRGRIAGFPCDWSFWSVRCRGGVGRTGPRSRDRGDRRTGWSRCPWRRSGPARRR